MKVRFKEDPREWLKFTLGFGVAPLILGGLLWWRAVIGARGFLFVLLGVALFEAVMLAVPKWRRGFYRAGLSVGSRIGHVMGQVLLTFVFFLLLTPIGLVMRLLGKDPLRLRRDPQARTYWHATGKTTGMDRMF